MHPQPDPQGPDNPLSQEDGQPGLLRRPRDPASDSEPTAVTRRSSSRDRGHQAHEVAYRDQAQGSRGVRPAAKSRTCLPSRVSC